MCIVKMSTGVRGQSAKFQLLNATTPLTDREFHTDTSPREKWGLCVPESVGMDAARPDLIPRDGLPGWDPTSVKGKRYPLVHFHGSGTSIFPANRFIQFRVFYVSRMLYFIIGLKSNKSVTFTAKKKRNYNI